MTATIVNTGPGKYGAGKYPFGTCQEGACVEAACYEVPAQDGKTKRVCLDHISPEIIYTPFLGAQTDFYSRTERWVLGGGGKGGAKALALDTPIAIPGGWTTMGAIGIGDELFDESGGVCRVTAKSRVFMDHDCYRVTFDNGDQIVADAGHRWKTYTNRERISLRRQEGRARKPNSPYYNDQRDKIRAPQIRTMAEIFKTQRTAANVVNHAVLVAGELILPSITLPIDPYVLGAWLGDGTSQSSGFTCDDREPFIINEIRRRGVEVKKYKAKNAYCLVGQYRPLRLMGLLNNKHIPLSYLRASAAQRMEMMQGLIDTDGHVHGNRSRVTIVQAKERLANDIYELANTLGLNPTIVQGRASLHGRDAGPVWIVNFTTTRKVALMPRKAARIRDRFANRKRWRYMVKIEKIEPAAVQCISVDSQSHLFLAGRSMIPTHNTHAASRLWLKQFYPENDRFKRGLITQSRGHFLFLRRTLGEMQQVIDEFLSYIAKVDPGHHWDARNKRCETTCGYKVEFGGMENEDDWRKYYGKAYSMVVLDEATAFTIRQIEEIDACVRCAEVVLGKTIQLIMTTNPIGYGLPTKAWLKRRFVTIAPPNTPVKVKVRLMDGRIVEEWQIYCPFNLFDNPALLRDGRYEASLSLRSEQMRRALLENDWDVEDGAWVGLDWDPAIHVCDPFAIPPGWFRFKCGDYGFASRSSINWFAVDPDGNKVLYRHLSATGRTAEELGLLIRQIEKQPIRWKGKVVVSPDWNDEADCSMVMGPMDSSLWARVGETGPSRGEILQSLGTGFYRSDKNSASAAEQVRGHLRRRTRRDDGTDTPGLRVWSTCKTRLPLADGSIEETGPLVTIPTCPVDPGFPDIWHNTSQLNHDLDAIGYGLLSRPLEGAEYTPMTKHEAQILDFVKIRDGSKPKNRFPDWNAAHG